VERVLHVHMTRLVLSKKDTRKRDNVEEFDNWETTNTASVRYECAVLYGLRSHDIKHLRLRARAIL